MIDDGVRIYSEHKSLCLFDPLWLRPIYLSPPESHKPVRPYIAGEARSPHAASGYSIILNSPLQCIMLIR